MKIEKVDYFLLIVGGLLAILTYYLSINPEAAESFSSMFNAWTGGGENFDIIGGLFAVTSACFLGAIVPFPVPYVIVVSVVAFQFWNSEIDQVLLLIVVILVATITNLVGDMLDWIVGRGAGKIKESSKSTEQEENRWSKLIYTKPKLIPPILFLFGATPLPESLLLMPLGVVKYPLGKTMLWSATGKVVMMTLVALAGIVGFGALLDLVGEGGGWITGMITLWLSFIIVAIMVKLD